MAKRDSFTLIEVMIVLTIVVSFLAIAWPRMRGLAAKTEIRQAAVDFKAACGAARDQAVRSGKPIAIRYQYGQSIFQQIDSDQQVDAMGQPSTGESMTVGSEPVANITPPVAYELPVGIVFADPDTLESDLAPDSFDSNQLNPDRLEAEDLLVVGQSTGGDWGDSQSVTFYPEGRSTSARVRLVVQESGDSITLTLRGLTGGVSIGDFEKPLEAIDEP